MTEPEFLALTDAVLEKIERAFDDADTDADTERNGGVLEIEFDDGAKIIVNRHAPNQELWLAARSGGFHYRYDHGSWINTRDGGELFSHLRQLVLQHSPVAPDF